MDDQPKYHIGCDPYHLDDGDPYTTITVFNSYGTAMDHYRDTPTFEQLRLNMMKWAPQMFTYTITGALCWLNHYCAEEQRRKEWLVYTSNQRMVVHTGIKLFNPYGKG